MDHSDENLDIDYEFLDTMRTYYPALFKKDVTMYKDRDVNANSWESLAKDMGGITVTQAKQWWDSLLGKYRTEKKIRDSESRSGSAAPVKRERFRLYEVMKDMLASSQTPRPSITNYKSSLESSGDVQEQTKNKAQFYQYQEVSGRGRKKPTEISNALNTINETLLILAKARDDNDDETSDDGDVESINKDIGNLIETELNNMDSEVAGKKRHLIMDRIMNFPKQRKISNRVQSND